MAGSETYQQNQSSSSSKSGSFQFDLTPEQQSLVDEFMNNTYPNWQKALESTAANLGSINQGAAADWGKQKQMIGAAQTPVNFTLGGANLATWVPYRTSMGNAIDKEAAYKTAGANAALMPAQAQKDFYADVVAPMQRQRQASLGSTTEMNQQSSGSSQSMGYIGVYNPKTDKSAYVPVGDVDTLLNMGWTLGTPDAVQAQSKSYEAMLDAKKPGLGQALTGGLALVKAGVNTWDELAKSDFWKDAKSVLGLDDQGLYDVVSTDAGFAIDDAYNLANSIDIYDYVP